MNDYAQIAAGMRAAQAARTVDRGPGVMLNVAHYTRPSRRHMWRAAGTTVNVWEPEGTVTPHRWRIDPDGTEHAEIPYDWELWTPPKRARAFPLIDLLIP